MEPGINKIFDSKCGLWGQKSVKNSHYPKIFDWSLSKKASKNSKKIQKNVKMLLRTQKIAPSIYRAKYTLDLP